MKAKLKQAKSKHGVYFIAELGQNHNGSLQTAYKMIDSLVGTGVSAIKTAKRDIDVCLSEEKKQSIYDNPNSFGITYYEHRKALELSKDDFIKLKQYAEISGFDFISSFTDLNSLDFLCDIGIKTLKIASQRIQDVSLLKAAARTNKPIIISTGMSSILDVELAMYIFENNTKYLLQCTSAYPCKEEDINLNVIKYYKDYYQADGYGLSGHHAGIAPDIAAYVMGADIIERHYTLSRAMKGTDHPASLERRGVELILKYISEISKAFGNYKKQILECEKPAIKKLR